MPNEIKNQMSQSAQDTPPKAQPEQSNRNISSTEPSERELNENLSGADSGMEKPKGQER